MNFDAILKTLLMIGADLPAYKALFDQVVDLFDDATQAELKTSYADALVKAEQAHAAAQAL